MNKICSEGLRALSVPTERGHFCFHLLWGRRANVSTNVWEISPPLSLPCRGIEPLAIDISHKSMAAETNISKLRD